MIATTLLPTPSFKCQKLGLSSTSAESGPINNYHNNSSIDFTNTPDIINSSNSKSLNPVDGIWSCLPNSPSRNIAFSTGNILKNPTYYYFSRQSKCKEEGFLSRGLKKELFQSVLPPPPHEQPDFPIQFGNWKEFVTEETREDLYTVVELLIPNFEIDQSFIRQACKYIRSCIGSIAIDLFIVKWTPLHDIDENDDNELEYLVSKLSPLWRQVESCVSSGHVKSVGISTRSAKVVSAVWRLAAVKPEAVFYEPRESEEKGLRDLNMLSQNLGFKVYLNRETPDICSEKTLSDLLKSTENVRLSALLSSKTQVIHQWILRYSIMQKRRSIILNKGYILMASAQ